MRSVGSFVFLTLVAVACGPSPSPNYPDSADGCASACAHLRGDDGSGLDCEIAEPSPNGATCEVVCQNQEDSGRMWNTPCLADASTCDDADKCSQ